MAVKIGQSYVSEAAASFAKNSVDDEDKNILKNLPEKNSPAVQVEISKKNFVNKNELMKHLQKNYSVVKDGAAQISSNFLQKCLNDEDEQKKLFENLDAAENFYKNAEKNQNLRVKIDSEGNMTTESSKTTVTFNESKRARQLAAAKTRDDVQKILNLLQNDLEECKEGLKNNWCDEEEVKKVEKMIERAKEIFNKVEKNNSETKNFSSVDILI